MKHLTLIAFLVSCIAATGAQATSLVDPRAASPIYDSSVDGNIKTITNPSDHAAGLSANVTFTPNAADIASVTAGMTLLEIGGNANGTGIYLLGGEVVFLGKMNGAAGNTPGAFDDVAYNDGNNMINVKSTFGQLTAGKTYTAAVAYDPITGNSLKLAVRQQGASTHVDSYALAGVGTKTNWSGNDTVTNLVGDGSIGAGNNVGGNAFDEGPVRANDFAGAKGQGLLWNTTGRILGEVALGWSAKGIADGALADWNTSIDNTGSGNSPFSWTGGSGGTKASGAPNLGNVGDWVNSPTYAFSDTSWQNALGNAETQKDATWEIVVRPGDFDDDHIIFDTGGNGAGTAFVLRGSTIEFRFQHAANANQRNFRTFDLSTMGSATDFFHIVGTADVAGQGPGIAQLYVNGVLVDGPVTSAGTINDWSGTNPASLGGFNKDIPGNTTFPADPFTGDLAVLNYYSDQILTDELIRENYVALVPEPMTMLAVGLSVAGLGGYLRKRRGR